MGKNSKKNLPRPPRPGGVAQLPDDDTTAIDAHSPHNESQGRIDATQQLSRNHQAAFPAPEKKKTDKDHHTKRLRAATDKHRATDHKLHNVKKRRKSSSARRSRRARSHAVHYRTKKVNSPWFFKMSIVLLPAMLLFLSYEHRSFIDIYFYRLLDETHQLVTGKIERAKNKSEITAVSDIKDSTYVVQPTSLAEVSCRALRSQTKEQNILELEFEVQFATAECHYLRGDYVGSYGLLHKNIDKLHDESLLLYTILLLKRKQFSEVTSFLKNKCQHVGGGSSFFPCLAQALLHLYKSGNITFDLVPSVAHENNSYSAIAWLLLALRDKTYTVSDSYLNKANTVGGRSNRRVALSYVYETLMRHIYLHGNRKNAEELLRLTTLELSDEHAAASWWVHFLARLKLTEKSKRLAWQTISSKSSLVHLYNNFDSLRIVGTESIRIGHSGALHAVLNKVSKNQRDTWGTSAKESMRFLERWKIRLGMANSRNRSLIKNIKKYAINYGEDYFYCFFMGVATLNRIGRSGDYTHSTKLISRSMLLHDSWETNYAYALMLLRGKQSTQLTNHMRKLERITITSAHKNWLFLLRAEIKINTGKHDAATADLRHHISNNPQSFTAHRLLVAAYQRANKHKEARVVRKAYDRLQKNIPYYNTAEGLSSPIGAFALL